MRQVEIGGRSITIHDFSGRKGIRILRTLEEIAKVAPAIQKKWEDYTKQYESENTIDMDRAYARSEFGPRPLWTEEPIIDETDNTVRYDLNGNPLVRRKPLLDENNQVIMGPDPLGHLEENDWHASDNKLKRPRSPSFQQQLIVVFPDMIDLAETETASLLGLIVMGNEDISRYGREGSEVIKAKAAEQGDWILDAPWNEIIELMVAAGEILEEQYREKTVGKLGPRLASILTVLGLKIPAALKIASSTTSATSSTDSQSATDGTKDSRSTELAGVGSTPSPTD